MVLLFSCEGRRDDFQAFTTLDWKPKGSFLFISELPFINCYVTITSHCEVCVSPPPVNGKPKGGQQVEGAGVCDTYPEGLGNHSFLVTLVTEYIYYSTEVKKEKNNQTYSFAK